MTPSRKRVLVQKSIEDARRWQENDAAWVARSGREGAEEELRAGGFGALKAHPVDLGQLATSEGVRGVVEVLDGVSDGWRRVDSSRSYRY
jgi:hypothetical protein